MSQPVDQTRTPPSPSAIRAVVVLYVLQLLVPFFLLTDIVVAKSVGYIEFRRWESDTVLVIACVLWLGLGLGGLLLWRDRGRFVKRVSGPLTAIYALFLCVLLLEVMARVALPKSTQAPAVRPPGARLTYDADSNEMPGVLGHKTFTVNEAGLRGPSFAQASGHYKIVTIGGSTTECVALDDSEEWPHLMMEEMNAREKKYPVWVGNAGVSGHNTAEHLVLLETLPLLKKVDLLIFLIGVNDLEPVLAFQGQPAQTHVEREAQRFRELLLAGGTPQFRLPLYKRLAVFRATKKAATVLAAKLKREGQQQEWRDLTKLRQRRRDAQVVPLPDLQTGLAEYHARVVRLAEQCQSMRVRCLFLTQPSLWRSDLGADEERLLWWGNVGRWARSKGYVSAADLARAMDAFNRELLSVCQEKMLECFDLASRVPKNISAFYDDQHFNEQGARIVARALTDFLLSKKPFADENSAAIDSGEVNWVAGVGSRIAGRLPAVEKDARQR